jgi:hypothetical protein
MRNPLDRNITPNYIRNGSFKTNNLKFWENPEGVSGYSIIDDTPPADYKILRLNTNAAASSITHKDFIRVQYGDIVNISYKSFQLAGITHTMDLLCYNSEGALLKSVTMTPNWIGLTSGIKSFNNVIPMGVSFIKPVLKFSHAVYATIEISQITLNIYENNNSLQIYEGVKVLDLTLKGNKLPNTTYYIWLEPETYNEVYEIQWLGIQTPPVPTATSGFQLINFYQNTVLQIAFIKTGYNQYGGFYSSTIVQSGGVAMPADNITILTALKGLKVTKENPLKITYLQDTTKTQTQDLLCFTGVIVSSIAEL